MAKGQDFTTAKVAEKSILIGVITPGQPVETANEYLDELEFLAHTAGSVTKARFQQKLQHPDPRTFVGKGKLQEIAEYIKMNEVGLAIFDDDLSPSQMRNIENELKCKVLDRTTLILDIFASRARTAQSKTQVELAQYNYLLPRLTGMWTHLERQKGGIGMRGPGETEIETDRRIIRSKISLLKERLKTIDKQNATRRKQRDGMVRVALVGYTNVGKSTLMNVLSKSEVFAEDKLFATLDTTVRKVVYGTTAFLLSDTVGFIRKLPHDLVESFKSTLDEVREADLLLHVVDCSHPAFEQQLETVQQTLHDIGAKDKNTIMVFNKIDRFKAIAIDHQDATEEHAALSLEEMKQTWMSKVNYPCVFISAAKNQNIGELRELIAKRVEEMSGGYRVSGS
jgi:GTP-binding protein HflX